MVHVKSGCDYHRVIMPLEYMGVKLDDFKDINTIERQEQIFSTTRVLIFNRMVKSAGGLEWILKMRKKFGFKIVCDVDDYWHLYPNHHQYAGWIENKYPQNIEACMRAADAVFVTNDLLYNRARQFSMNVHVVPNGLPFGRDQFNAHRNESDEFRVMYAGGSSHFWDVREMRVALEKLNKDNLGAQYIMAGHNGKPDGDFAKIERVFNLGNKLKGYRRQLALPLESYMDSYNNADLSLAPLVNNRFNECKSNLKTIEAGCKNIPIICSNMLPYAEELDSKFIMLASNTREWYENIRYCIKNPNFTKDSGESLGHYVRARYDLFKINELRKQIFESLK